MKRELSNKTFSAKLDTKLLQLLEEVCKQRRLVKAKIVEDAIRLKLEDLAEEQWAIEMLKNRAGDESLPLDEFKRRLKKK